MTDISLVTPYLSKKEQDELMSIKKQPFFRGGIINKEFITVDRLKDIISINNGEDFFWTKKSIGNTYLHSCGAYYLLDPSSYHAMMMLSNLDHKIILDACAAPGGKTITLALKNRNSLIIANEINTARCKILKENIERMGLRNVIVTNHSLDFFLQDFSSFFDAVILDAPCSGSGMYRKNESVDNDWSIEKVKRLSLTQENLLNTASLLIKDGGVLSYSTCSFSLEEDEQVKENFLKHHLNFHSHKLKEDDRFLSLDAFDSIHFLPTRFNGEGHYLAIFIKDGNIKNRNDILFNEKSEYNLNGLVYVIDHRFNFINKLCPVDGGVLKHNKNEKSVFSYAFGRAYGFDKTYYLKNEQDCLRFMHGEELDCDKISSEEVLIQYDNLRLGFGKTINNRIKNYLPKRVRLTNI